MSEVAGAATRVKRHWCVKAGRMRFVWMRGDLIQIGNWYETGFGMRGWNVVKWWCFGRLYIELEAK